jgi:hypothetical protein
MYDEGVSEAEHEEWLRRCERQRERLERQRARLLRLRVALAVQNFTRVGGAAARVFAVETQH